MRFIKETGGVLILLVVAIIMFLLGGVPAKAQPPLKTGTVWSDAFYSVAVIKVSPTHCAVVGTTRTFADTDGISVATFPCQ